MCSVPKIEGEERVKTKVGMELGNKSAMY